jgi:tetratricopeptide (TPR) repeat protein
MHAYYPDADPRPDTDRTYVHTVYIECKQRGHPLALDETAKVFVVAIADQPDRLVIVCQQGIQDQVWIYASKLFESENRKGIFKNVRFEATSIDELLGLSEGDGGTDLRDYYKYSWKFWLRSLDQLQLVASAGRSAAGRINIAPQTKFLITVKETKGLPISGLRVMHNNRETLIIEKSSTNGLSVAENTAFHLGDRHLQWFLESNPSEWTWKLIPISGDDIDLSKATWQADPLLNFRLRSPSFKETLEELRYESLSSEDYSFELQLAYLAQDAQQSGLASYKFENAANQAKTNNNYSIERLSLEGYFKILSNANSLDQSNYRKQIAVGLRLGGVEIQAGSQLKALRHLDSIIDSLQLTGTQIFDSNQEATLYLLDSFQQKLVLATRTMNPILFCSVWGNAFAMNNDLPPARHRNLLTRLVLICCAANSPRIARIVAEILLNNEFEGVTLAKETLYSDIGRIYLQSNPKLTLKYWKEGLDSASTERQRTHNLLNVMVGELIANNRFESKKNLAEFRVRLANTGVINQQLRFGLIEGLFHSKNGDFDSSILVTKKLLERAKKNNQFFWLWKCHNNLAVIYYELGRQTDAVDHISAALELIDNIWKFETVREHKLMEAFKVSCSMFGADGSQPKLEKSQYSGAYRVPLHNGSIILRDKKIAPEEIPQSLSEDHVMCRLVGSRKLLFALE